jgi:hypothetical protein
MINAISLGTKTLRSEIPSWSEKYLMMKRVIAKDIPYRKRVAQIVLPKDLTAAWHVEKGRRWNH